jgi:hypothetical protein
MCTHAHTSKWWCYVIVTALAHCLVTLGKRGGHQQDDLISPLIKSLDTCRQQGDLLIFLTETGGYTGRWTDMDGYTDRNQGAVISLFSFFKIRELLKYALFSSCRHSKQSHWQLKSRGCNKECSWSKPWNPPNLNLMSTTPKRFTVNCLESKYLFFLWWSINTVTQSCIDWLVYLNVIFAVSGSRSVPRMT